MLHLAVRDLQAAIAELTFEAGREGTGSPSPSPSPTPDLAGIRDDQNNDVVGYSFLAEAQNAELFAPGREYLSGLVSYDRELRSRFFRPPSRATATTTTTTTAEDR